jgi:hypothetical protein
VGQRVIKEIEEMFEIFKFKINLNFHIFKSEINLNFHEITFNNSLYYRYIINIQFDKQLHFPLFFFTYPKKKKNQL